MHHAALDRARAARSRPRSPGRRSSAASAAAASLICARDSIWNTPTVSAAADHVVGGVVLGAGCRCSAIAASRACAREQVERLADRGQHAEREHVDLEQAQRFQVVLVPLDDGAVGHRRVLDRHQLRAAARSEITKPPTCCDRWRGNRAAARQLRQRRTIGARDRSRSRAGARGAAAVVEPVVRFETRVDPLQSTPSAVPTSRSALRGR